MINQLNERADAGSIDKDRLRVFTFNDTVVIVYLADGHGGVTIDDVRKFCLRLRAFLMLSLRNQILLGVHFPKAGFMGSMRVQHRDGTRGVRCGLLVQPDRLDGHRRDASRFDFHRLNTGAFDRQTARGPVGIRRAA